MEKRAQTLTIIAAFGVLYSLLRLIAPYPLVGLPGARLSLGELVLPLFGIILGPIGAFAAVIGSFLSFMLGRPPVYFGLDFLTPATNSLLAGLIATGRRIWASLTIGLLMVLFAIHPYTVMIIPGIGLPFIWLHAIALLLVISPLGELTQGFLLAAGIEWRFGQLWFFCPEY